MKTIMIAGSALLLSATVATAQSESGAGRDDKETRHELRKTDRELKKNERNASYQSMAAFMYDFPDAKSVSWKVTGYFEEATFISNGIPMTAYYDVNSELVGTTTEKTFSDIPVAAQEHIEKSFKGYTPGEVILFDDNEYNDTDMILWGSPFEDEDNYFVSLKNDKETIIVKVNRIGTVSFFKKL